MNARTFFFFSVTAAFTLLLPSAAQAQSEEHSPSAEVHSNEPVDAIVISETYPAEFSQVKNHAYAVPAGTPSVPMYFTAPPQAAACTSG